jgi:PAS domain-containing protein
MAQKDIELILMRQLASCLATPVFLVDPKGNLVFYNEHAEPILGRRYEETGPMPVEVWSSMFHPMDELDQEMLPSDLPLVMALRYHRPAHKKFWIRGLDGIKRQIEVTAFPLIGQSMELVGAVSMFAEVME